MTCWWGANIQLVTENQCYLCKPFSYTTHWDKFHFLFPIKCDFLQFWSKKKSGFFKAGPIVFLIFQACAMLSYVIVCNIRIRTTSKWIWWSLKHAVCVFWMVENQMVSVIPALEKSNIREDGFFIPIPLFFLWLTCSIASAEIFISIYRESFGLTSKSQLDFEIFIFVPLFCVMMVYWKRKDEDGSWKSITISWQNQNLFLCSTLGKNL